MKCYIRLQQPVGANDNIYIALLGLCQIFLNFFRRNKAAHQRDPQAERRQTFFKRDKVLLS